MTESQYPDSPLYEREMPGERFTLRVSVTFMTDGTTYAALTTEPNTGPLYQHIFHMTRQDWIALADMAEHAVRVIDRQERAVQGALGEAA